MKKKLDRASFAPSLGWRVLVAGVLAATFLGVDQITKAVVRATLGSGIIGVQLIPGIIGFEYVENTGVAFGLASGYGAAFVVLAVAVVIASAAYLWRAPLLSKLEVAGIGMVVGGAVGNALDRAVHGFVTDFIATEFINFPVFNVADIGITVGVVLAFIGFLFLSPANAEAKRRAEEDREIRLEEVAERRRAAREQDEQQKKGRS